MNKYSITGQLYQGLRVKRKSDAESESPGPVFGMTLVLQHVTQALFIALFAEIW